MFNYNELSSSSKLPKRSDYVSGNCLAGCKPVNLCINDLTLKTNRGSSVLMGSAIAASGQKVLLVLNSIPIYIDVRVYGGFIKFKDIIAPLINCTYMEEIKQYPGKEFVLTPQTYCRVHFATKSKRKTAIETLYNRIVTIAGKSYQIEMANDDSDLMMLVLRHCGINSCGWNRFAGYTVASSYGYIDQLVTDINKIAPIEGDNIDRTLLCGWDLETTTDSPDGRAPKAYRRDSYITMNALVFRWRGESDALCKFIITDVLVPEVPGVITIMCRDQNEIIDATALILKRMYPDFIVGFNDGGYDWKFINWRINPAYMNKIDTSYKQDLTAERKRIVAETKNKSLSNQPSIVSQTIRETANTKRLYNKFITAICPFKFKNNKYNVTCKSANKARIKIPNAAPPSYNHVKCAGMVGFDVLIELCKKHPKTPKKNLNYWLTRYKLAVKADMKYDLMDRIFSISTLARLCGIKSYTELVDAIKSGKFRVCTDDACIKPECMCHSSDMRIRSILDKRGAYDIRFGRDDLLNHIVHMDKVSIYNTRDSEAVLDLVDKANIINDVREKCILSYTMLLDGFYRADSIKVANLVARVASQPKWGRNNDSPLGFPMYMPYTNETIRDKDKLKYEGAFVFQPKKGCYSKTLFEKRAYRRYGKIANCYPDKPGFDETLLLSDVQIADILGNNVNRLGIFDYMDVDCTHRFKTILVSPDKHSKLYDIARNKILARPNTWIDYFNTVKKPCVDILDCFDRPKSGLDFSSLYPSIIMAYNNSTDMFVKDPAFAAKLMQLGYKLLKASVVYKRADDPVTPENTHIGWFVQHGGLARDYAGMGIFAYILRDLFNRRKVLKRKMNYWKSGLERIKRDIDPVVTDVTYDAVIGVLRKKQDQYANKARKLTGIRQSLMLNKVAMYDRGIKFIDTEIGNMTGSSFAEKYAALKSCATLKSMKYNTKQLALKVFMNTFYGAAGFNKSTLFIVELSGCVTKMGKKSIKRAQRYVERHGFEVFYGDTDSIYISPPENCFTAADEAYTFGKLSKEAFFEEMVAITMTQMGIISKQINTKFRKTTGTEFLRMAYEEVTFPVILTGKKKYAAIEHITSIDFSLARAGASFKEFCADLFVRGLDFVKRGGSELMKENCQRVLYEAFCLDDNRMLKDIVVDNVTRIINTKWDVSYLQKSYCYRLTKSGTVNHIVRFVQRMQVYEESGVCNIRAPILGERFNAIKCREYVDYDFGGAKIKQKTGDLLEYPEMIGNKEYEKLVGHPIEPDLLYYLTDVLGKFARYLSYHPDWNTHYQPNMTDAEYKKSDAKAAEEIKKRLVAQHCGGFTADVSKAKLYKRKYREFVAKYKEFGDKRLMRAVAKGMPIGETVLAEIEELSVPDPDWSDELYDAFKANMGMWRFRKFVCKFIKRERYIDRTTRELERQLSTLIAQRKSAIIKEQINMRMLYDGDLPIEFTDEFRDVVVEIDALKHRIAGRRRLVNQYRGWKVKLEDEANESVGAPPKLKCDGILEDSNMITLDNNEDELECNLFSSFADDYNKKYKL